tara:strand:- start:1300 stop:4776 length:3477 start_codon:yes stop_codon:yes gene_type:complete
MWALREDVAVDMADVRSPRRYVRAVRHKVDGPENVGVSICNHTSETNSGDAKKPDDTWCVGGFDVFARRTSPLRRKRAPLTPREFDCDALVTRTLEEARGLEKSGSDPERKSERVPLSKLVPGNKSLHQRLSEERATSREETLTHGTPVSSRGVTLSNATADSTPNAHTGPEHSPASSEESTSSFWCAEKRKSEFPEFEQTVRETKYSYETSENERRDARRRHRKRLATIVVAQWRWFSKDALDDLPGKMHHEWRRKKKIVREWRRVAGEESSLAALRAVAAAREKRLKRAVQAFTVRRDEMTHGGTVGLGDDRHVMTDITTTQMEPTSTSFETLNQDSASVLIQFRRWRRYTRNASQIRKRKAQRNAMADARQASRKRTMKRCMVKQWHLFTAKKKARKILKQKIVASVLASVAANGKTRHFTIWRDLIGRLRVGNAIAVARFARHRTVAVSRNAFVNWRDGFVKPRIAVKQFTEGIKRRRNSQLMQKTWTAWFDALPVLKEERNIVTNCWHEWTDCVSQTKWRIGKADTFRAALVEKTKGEFFSEWKFSTKESLRDEKFEFSLRKLLTAQRLEVLRNAFCDGFSTPVQMARNNSKADTQLLRYKSRKALQVWIQFERDQKNKKAKKQNAILFHKKYLLEMTWSRWAVSFMKKQRKLHSSEKKLARALATRRALISCRAFIGWSYQSKVVGRAKRRILRDAVNFRNAFLVTQGFSVWRVVMDTRKELDLLDDAKLELVMATLSATKTARVFDTFVEWTRSKLARRAVKNVAVTKHKNQTLKSSLFAWRHFVTDRVTEQKQLETATKHSDTRLTYCAVEAWVKYVVQRRRDGLLRYKAETFLTNKRAQKAFKSLQLHKNIKAEKRNRLTMAIESHRISLLKDGCGAWLSEGFRRRELRSEFLVDKVADETARKTVLVWRSVAKYATRWLRETRKRKGRVGTGIQSGSVSKTGTVEPFLETTLPSRSTLSLEAPPTAPYAVQDTFDSTTPPVFVAPAKRNRPPPRRGDLFVQPTVSALRLFAHTIRPSKPPVTRPPRVPMTSAACIDTGSRDSYVDTSEDVTYEFTPQTLDRHESIIAEYETLKAESVKLKGDLMDIDQLLHDGEISEIQAATKKGTIHAAAAHVRYRRAALLPAVRQAAFALGEARSDLASTAAGSVW